MRMHVADVTIAAGVLLTAPGMAAMCCTVLRDHSPHQMAVGLVVLGVVLTIAGLVPRLGQHQDGWRSQTEALRRARQRSQHAAAVSQAHEPAGAQLTCTVPGSRTHLPGEDPARAAPALAPH